MSVWFQIFLQLVNSFSYANIKTISTNYLKLIDGINFMDYFLLNYSEVFLYISPSQTAQNFLLHKIATICKQLTSKSHIKLVTKLNILLFQWRYYFCLSNSTKIFSLLDYLIYLKLRKWSFRRYSYWNTSYSTNKSFLCYHQLINDYVLSFSQETFISYQKSSLYFISLKSLLY